MRIQKASTHWIASLNVKDHIVAVGDVHGCGRVLVAILEALLQLPIRCVFLGDYVDRGPDSVRVVGLLAAAKATRPDWVFLLGNHELMLRENLALGIDPRIQLTSSTWQ